LEATFDFRLSYKDRRKQIIRYGKPDSKWTTCPSISPVVVATLPSAALKDDKVAFQAQEMYMEAMAPLAESTDDENFTIKEAIPMVQSAVRLLGDATQYHLSIRRKAIMQHLNSQLQTLMKDVDFKGSQLLLFGEDFGEKAKSKMEAAAALKKVVNPTVPKGKSGFQKSHPQKTTWGHQGGKTKQYSPTYKAKKNQGAKTSQGKSRLDTLNLSLPHVSILIVNPIPLLIQVSAQKHHLEVLIGQMNLTISSPMLAGRLAQFNTNW